MESLLLVFLLDAHVWDVRLENSVVSAHVNLNALMLHVKNRKMKNLSANWFGLTDLNKTMGNMSGRKKKQKIDSR